MCVLKREIEAEFPKFLKELKDHYKRAKEEKKAEQSQERSSLVDNSYPQDKSTSLKDPEVCCGQGQKAQFVGGRCSGTISRKNK